MVECSRVKQSLVEQWSLLHATVYLYLNLLHSTTVLLDSIQHLTMASLDPTTLYHGWNFNSLKMEAY